MVPLVDVPLLREDEALEHALAELGEGLGRALVLDGGRLVGFLSMTDLVRALEVGGPRRRTQGER